MKRPNGIVLHHSDTEQGNAASFKRYHLSIGYSTIGYHFVILKDGTIEVGRNLSQKGAHCRGNNSTVGICLVGKLENKQPTAAQYISLVRLLTSLCFIYNFNPYNKYEVKGKMKFLVAGHLDFCSTDCPGDAFYKMLPKLRNDVRKQLDTMLKIPKLK